MDWFAWQAEDTHKRYAMISEAGNDTTRVWFKECIQIWSNIDGEMLAIREKRVGLLIFVANVFL